MWNFLLAKINVSRVHNKSLNTSACITIHTPLLLLSLIIYLSYQPAIFQFLTRLPLLEREGPKHSIYATSLVKCSQGLDSKIKGTRVIHFFNAKGLFVRHAQLQLWWGIKCVFAVIKELRGLHLQVLSKYFHILSDIVKFYVVEGVILTFKSIKLFNTGTSRVYP